MKKDYKKIRINAFKSWHLHDNFNADILQELIDAIEDLSDKNQEANDRITAIVDWCDLALKNPQEFNSHGVRNLDGPVFDEARKYLEQK